jgi:ectoine hydroxylase-related dioxygenase (phytanoyl-CoA dioxygenase family)
VRLNELSDANEILDNPPALAERYERDGCLLLRNALTVPDLTEVIDHTVAAFERWGVGTLSASTPGEPPALRWTGQPMDALDDEELHRARSLDPSAEEFRRIRDALNEVLDHVFCRPMEVWSDAALRVNLPDDPVFVTSPHRDGMTFSPLGDYRRVWIALTDIPFGDNGLALAPGTHRLGKLSYQPLPEFRRRPSTFWNTPRGPRPGLGPEVVDAWHTAHMHPGDALLFSKKVIHRGLPATSDRIRVAMTFTASTEGSPRPPATLTNDYERVRRIRALAAPLGLNEKDVMKVRADLMMTGLEVNQATVEEAMAGQHAGWRADAYWG